MAVPSYTEDLTDISTMEATTGVSALGGGGAGLSADPDFAIQGTNAVTKQVTGAGTQKGLMYDNGAAITLGANDHIFQWVYATCPGLIDSIANSGMTVSIGSATGDRNDYSVNGNDTYAKGGHFCYPIRYTAAVPSPGTQTGTPAASPQFSGGQLKTIGTIKAVNLSVDASRYGTGAYITAGEIANPATFGGFATQNDLVGNQWGILTAIPGGFALQGRFVVGQDNTGTPALAYFADSAISLVITDTIHSLTDFSQIIIDHASTIVILDTVSITALGTNNRGRVVVNNASSAVTITGGTWTGLGTISLQAATTMTGTVLSLTDSITLNGATLTDCTISNSRAASSILGDDLAKVSACTIESDGTNHAVELSSIGAGSMTWNNSTTGYETGVAGSPITPTATGNEDIYVNVGSGTLTINVSAGGTTPSVRSAGAIINVVSSFTLSLEGLIDTSRVIIVNSVTRVVLSDQTAGPSGALTYAHSGGEEVDILPIHNDYKLDASSIYDLTLDSGDQTIKISQPSDLFYDNP